jgi:hypothetical protein
MIAIHLKQNFLLVRAYALFGLKEVNFAQKSSFQSFPLEGKIQHK